jgi:hypothetical protein
MLCIFKANSDPPMPHSLFLQLLFWSPCPSTAAQWSKAGLLLLLLGGGNKGRCYALLIPTSLCLEQKPVFRRGSRNVLKISLRAQDPLPGWTCQQVQNKAEVPFWPCQERAQQMPTGRGKSTLHTQVQDIPAASLHQVSSDGEALPQE